MIRLSGTPFGFGWHTGRTRRYEPTHIRITLPPETALLVSENTADNSLLAALRTLHPCLLILPACSTYSHFGAAIWATGIPTLSIDVLPQIPDGSKVGVDLEAGELCVAENSAEASLLCLRQRDDVTPCQPCADGHRLSILSEISPGGDVAATIAAGADGISTLKTEEFLEANTETLVAWAKSSLPSPHMLLRFYDPALDPHSRRECVRAPLGYRGIRCLEAEPHRLPQFRRFLESIEPITTTIILPMVTSVSEVRRFRRQVDSTRASIGVTVETPAAALQIDELVPELHFVEIGLNDLTQYTMAWDRDAPNAERLPPDTIAEPVQKLIRNVNTACRTAKLPCALGLDLKPSRRLGALLVDLGVETISCAPILVPHWRRLFPKR